MQFHGPARLVALGLLALTLACQPSWTAPERRARQFIESLIVTPTDHERLRDIANLPPESAPDSLIADLSARVGLDFLRARRDQGLAFKIVAGDAQQPDPARRSVTVHVTYLEPGTPVTGEVRFQVQLAHTEANDWRITRVLGDN